MAELRQSFDVRDDGQGKAWLVIGVMTDAGTRFEWGVPVAQAEAYAAEFARNVAECVKQFKDANKPNLVVPGTHEVLSINGKR